MSQQVSSGSENPFSTMLQANRRRITELSDAAKQVSEAFWFNPQTKQITIGERFGNNGEMIPTYDVNVRNVEEMAIAQNRARSAGVAASNTEIDHAKYGGWSQEFLPVVMEWIDALERTHGHIKRAEDYLTTGSRARSAGIVRAGDFTNMVVPNVLGQVLNTIVRPHFLLQAVTTVPVPNLTVSIDTWAGFGISEDLGEFDYAVSQKGSVSRQTFALKKNIGHIAFSEEFDMQQYYHNVEQLHVNYISLQNEVSKNQKVGTELETASSASSNDWGALNGTNPAVSLSNPLDDLGNPGDTLYDSLANVDRIITGTRARRDFYTNSYLRGMMQPAGSAGGMVSWGGGIDGTMEGVGGVKWIFDRLITATIAIIMDSQAVWFLDGPKRQAVYEDSKIGFRGIVSKDWHAVKTVQSTKIKKLTGVSS